MKKNFKHLKSAMILILFVNISSVCAEWKEVSNFTQKTDVKDLRGCELRLKRISKLTVRGGLQHQYLDTNFNVEYTNSKTGENFHFARASLLALGEKVGSFLSKDQAISISDANKIAQDFRSGFPLESYILIQLQERSKPTLTYEYNLRTTAGKQIVQGVKINPSSFRLESNCGNSEKDLAQIAKILDETYKLFADEELIASDYNVNQDWNVNKVKYIKTEEHGDVFINPDGELCWHYPAAISECTHPINFELDRTYYDNPEKLYNAEYNKVSDNAEYNKVSAFSR